MVSSNDPQWLPENRKISDEEWEQFRERHAKELSLEYPFQSREDFIDARMRISEREPAFSGNHNWHLLMPDDAITRMKHTKQPYEVFKEIVNETADVIFKEIEPEPWDLRVIAEHIITRFKGGSDLHFQEVRNNEFEPEGEYGNSVYDDMTIVVKSTNSRNLEDWYVYVVENPSKLFGSTIYSMTHAAHIIYEAELEPEFVLQDVAFTLEDQGMKTESVSGVTAPEHPVSVVATDVSDFGYYYRVDSPQKIFGEEWGDVDAMDQHLSKESIEGKEIGLGAIGFWVVTGVNW